MIITLSNITFLSRFSLIFIQLHTFIRIVLFQLIINKLSWSLFISLSLHFIQDFYILIPILLILIRVVIIQVLIYRLCFPKTTTIRAIRKATLVLIFIFCFYGWIASIDSAFYLDYFLAALLLRLRIAINLLVIGLYSSGTINLIVSTNVLDVLLNIRTRGYNRRRLR